MYRAAGRPANDLSPSPHDFLAWGGGRARPPGAAAAVYNATVFQWPPVSRDLRCAEARLASLRLSLSLCI